MKANKYNRLQVCKRRLQAYFAKKKRRLQVCKPLYMLLQIANMISHCIK
jgi:hypothetical protein